MRFALPFIGPFFFLLVLSGCFESSDRGEETKGVRSEAGSSDVQPNPRADADGELPGQETGDWTDFPSDASPTAPVDTPPIEEEAEPSAEGDALNEEGVDVEEPQEGDAIDEDLELEEPLEVDEEDQAQESELDEASKVIHIEPNSSWEEFHQKLPGAFIKSPSQERQVFYGAVSEEVSRAGLEARDFVESWLQSSFPMEMSLELVSEESLKEGRLLQFRFRQLMWGLPVEGSDLRVHVFVTTTSYRINYMASQLAPVSSKSFDPAAPLSQLDRIQFDHEILNAGLQSNREPEPSVFYPFDGEALPKEARPVWKIFAVDDPVLRRQVRSFYFDAITKEFLISRNHVHHHSASGTVTGFGSVGVKPDRSIYDLVELPLQDLLVWNSDSGFGTHTNPSGSYSLVDPSGGTHPVEAEMTFVRDPSPPALIGLQVWDFIDYDPITQTGDFIPSLVTSISSNTTGLHYQFNSDGLWNETATVNVFHHVQKAYRYFTSRGGVADLETRQIRADVNRNETQCNARHIASAPNLSTLEFFQEDTNCVNSAYSTVIAHEYGHYVVEARGLGQGAFGEGYSDSLAMLLYDTPGVGYDFLKDGDYLRHPQSEDVRYPCSGGIYTCGSVLSALFWDLRLSMGLEAARQLHVDWTRITMGGLAANAAHPHTIVELLLADDDDGDITNGTPNWNAICQAAQKRNLPCPEQLSSDFPNGLPNKVFPGQTVSINIHVSSGFGSPQANTGVLHYRIDGGTWQQIPMTQGLDHEYSVNLPLLYEGQTLEYYFSAQTTLGFTQTFPAPGRLSSFLIQAQSPYPTTVSYQLPRNPARVLGADKLSRAANNPSVFVLTDTSGRGFMELTAASLGRPGALAARIPQSFHPGASSLFYRHEDEDEFVLTNQSRTEVYLGLSNASDPVFHNTTCSGFSNISDVHLVYDGGSTWLIVADKGTGLISSFEIDLTTPEFCVNRQDMGLPGVEWVTSPADHPSPVVIYVGSRDAAGLKMRVLQVSNMSSHFPSVVLSTSNQAEFRSVFSDPISSRVLVGVTKAVNSPFGEDHIRELDEAGGFDESFQTCRAPDEILQDFEPGNRYRYVLCKSAGIVRVYNTDRDLLATLPAGPSPRQMLVTSDGTTRWVAILQNNASLRLYSIPSASNPIQANFATIPLPGKVTEMNLFASLDGAVLSSYEKNSIIHVDFQSASVVSTMRFPEELDAIAVEDAHVGVVASRSSGSVYRLTMPTANASGAIEFYDVGGRPIQVAARPNEDRAYVLSQLSETFSVINTDTGALTQFATGARPVHFDYSLDDDLLWVANRDSESISVYNVDPGNEAWVANLPMGFRVQHIRYEPGEQQLYAGGDNTLVQMNRVTGAVLQTYTIPGRVSEIQAFRYDGNISGVLVTSDIAGEVHFVNNGQFDRVELAGAPTRMAVSPTLGRAVFLHSNSQMLQWLDWDAMETAFLNLGPLPKLFGLGERFVTYEPQAKSLRFYDSALLSGGEFPSVEFQNTIEVDRAAVDANQNIWVSSKSDQKVQRFDSALQPEIFSNLVLNRPVDAIAHEWTAHRRLYVLMRNISAVFVFDLPSGQMVDAVQTCRSPRKMILDGRGGSERLFVKCPRDSVLSVLDLNAAGLVVGSQVWSTGKTPSDLYRVDDELFVTSRSESLLQIFDATAATAPTPTNISVQLEPMSLVADEPRDLLYIISQNSTNIDVYDLDGSALLAPVSTGHPGLQKGIVNTVTGSLYAISTTPGKVFAGVPGFQFIGTPNPKFFPKDISFSVNEEKVVVSYPQDDLLRIYDEDNMEIVELEVGQSPGKTYRAVGAARLYVALVGEDAVSIHDPATNSLIVKRSLSPGCSPSGFSELDNQVFVLCRGLDRMEVLNLTTHELESPISLRILQ